MRRATAAVRGILVLVVVLVVGACSDDGVDGGESASSTTVTTTATTAGPEVATESFVGNACTALATLEGQTLLLDQAVVAGQPGEVTAAYTRVAEVVDGLVSQVSAVPAPGVEGGADIKASVVAAWQAAAATVRAAEATVTAASTAGDAAAAAAAEEGVTTVQSAVDSLRSTLAGLAAAYPSAGDELLEAFGHEHDCEGLVTE